jgi:predicted MarR family transcription regulator
VSGTCDSIRERRTRDSWENGGRRAKTTKTTSLAYEVVRRFSDSREQLLVLEKLCEGRLDFSYLEWNGRIR